VALARIKLPVGLVGADGPRELECDGVTVGEALQDCVAKDPRLKPRIFREGGGVWVGIFVNGRNIRSIDGMDTVLRDGDEIRLMPPIAGG
jgi:molybdopterin synthase sulfur carrier subunit